MGLIQPVREGDEETIETGPDDNKDGINANVAEIPPLTPKHIYSIGRLHKECHCNKAGDMTP